MRKMTDRSMLPGVERMLTAAARRRLVAGREARRHRGTGLAMVAAVGLALGGSAMAATGIWSPLGGGDRPPSETPALAGPLDLISPRYRPVTAAPAAASVPAAASRRRPAAGSGELPSAESLPIPVAAPEGGSEEKPSRGSGVKPEGIWGGPAGALTGGGAVAPSAGAPQHEGKGAGKPEQPAAGPTPGAPPVVKDAPTLTQISLSCNPAAVPVEQATHCVVLVVGNGRLPSGEVLVKSGAVGAFPTAVGSPPSATCALEDDGSGASASCGVDYVPGAVGAHELFAYFNGDGTTAPGDTSFVLKGLP